MNFNGVAPFYDASARLVFGQEHRRAEAFFISSIPENSRVLLVGGGTGWSLAQLLQTRRPGEVVFLEPSGRMRRRAQRRVATLTNAGAVRFVTSAAQIHGSTFDVLLTPYVLDLFTDAQLGAHFLPPLLGALAPGGRWLFTDFAGTRRGGQRLLLRLMYAIFRLLCGIPARHLPDYEAQFRRWGFRRVNAKLFFGGMIETVWLEKNG
ncbi:MAG: methyltransferase domain-containing protein [Cytophagaceae bacterium]|nr:methyltransferase domain-containing protein [Cytophagaceae bacterium]